MLGPVPPRQVQIIIRSLSRFLDESM
jgi:hypothetical protein